MAPPRKADIEEASKYKFEKQGMEWDRTCTDIICCVIFIVFLGAMLGVSGFAVSNGDPLNIIAPFDSVGN
jgi:solute carrier family 44 (choline transporter-like protein), member 2/4/5